MAHVGCLECLQQIPKRPIFRILYVRVRNCFVCIVTATYFTRKNLQKFLCKTFLEFTA